MSPLCRSTTAMGLCYCSCGASKSTSGFDPQWVHMRFLMDTVEMGQVSLLFPCLCHSIDAPYSSSYIHCSYLEDKLEKSWIFGGNGGALDRKVLPRHQLVYHTEKSVSIIKTNSRCSSYLTEKNFHYKWMWLFM
jgi:hypothetical protein